ncbi:MAG TPA: RHS repeat-associated core domain-containing protein [Spirochaetota bacterium]|nr:RHS repeat-associated core domain-containing protein [Spirochaetota bacterium]
MNVDKGDAVTRTEYKPYGETWVQEGDKTNRPKFNSQELDPETGYYFYNARYYEAEIGRFITADNIIDGEYSTQGWNRFSYVKNNPVRYKDPSGNFLEFMFFGNDTVLDPLIRPMPEIVGQTGKGVLEGVKTGTADAAEALIGTGRSRVIANTEADSITKSKAEAKTKASSKKESDPKKWIIIGENMERVRFAAKSFQAEYFPKDFKIALYTGQWKIPGYSNDNPVHVELSCNRNADWVKRKIRQGYNVIDIGIDKSRSPKDREKMKNYKVEKETVEKMKGRREFLHIKFPVLSSDELKKMKGYMEK